MPETTTTPLMLDVYRGVIELRDLSDDTTWRDSYEAGLSDAFDICGSNWLIHGRVNRKDVREINPSEHFCTIYPEKVEVLELIPLGPSTFAQMVDQLAGSDPRLQPFEEELDELLGENEEND